MKKNSALEHYQEQSGQGYGYNLVLELDPNMYKVPKSNPQHHNKVHKCYEPSKEKKCY